MPTQLNVEIKVKLGRNLGAQEIFSMFNNGYKRDYASNNPKKTASTSSTQSTYVSKDPTTSNSASNIPPNYGPSTK
jgi:hypothetical protein